jgi:hypothetical protein
LGKYFEAFPLEAADACMLALKEARASVSTGIHSLQLPAGKLGSNCLLHQWNKVRRILHILSVWQGYNKS